MLPNEPLMTQFRLSIFLSPNPQEEGVTFASIVARLLLDVG
jgi:hypothetical protein